MKGFCRVQPCRRLEGVELFEMSQQVWTALINNAIIANRTRQTSSRLRMSSDQRLFWHWKENSLPLSHLLDLLEWQQRQLNNHRSDQHICIFMGVFAKRKCSADRREGSDVAFFLLFFNLLSLWLVKRTHLLICIHFSFSAVSMCHFSVMKTQKWCDATHQRHNRETSTPLWLLIELHCGWLPLWTTLSVGDIFTQRQHKHTVNYSPYTYIPYTETKLDKNQE